MGFIRINPNPENNKTGDCVVRAIAIAMDKSWHEIYWDLCFVGAEMGDWGNSNPVWGAYLKRNGFRQYTLPSSCPDCYTVSDFCDDHRNGIYILATGSHVVTVINGDYYDLWDSGNEVPVYFWKRKEW